MNSIVHSCNLDEVLVPMGALRKKHRRQCILTSRTTATPVVRGRNRLKQTTTNRLLAASASEPEDISRLQDDKRSLEQSLERHRKETEESHKYYVDAVKKSKDHWGKIKELHFG